MKSIVFVFCCRLVFCLVVSGPALLAPLSAMAASSAPDIINIIHSAYPDARILKQREDIWQGESVTEVELRTAEGKRLEITVSKLGEILDIEEESELPFIGGSLTLGLGGHWESAFYKGEDSEFNPAPFLHYENGPFEIQAYGGLSAMYSFYEFNGFYFAAKAVYENDQGYDAEESKYLSGMDELDDVLNAGLQIGKRMGKWSADLEVLQDVSGEHKGQQASLEISRQIDIGKFTFRPGISLGWMSSKMVEYYYGVGSHEVRSDRPLYSPSAGFEAGVELFFQRELFHNFSLIGQVQLSLPTGEIKDSPLVDENYQVGAVLGIAYDF